MSVNDWEGNALVDYLAKEEAKKGKPSEAFQKLVVGTSRLVTAIAKWIGQCTVRANSASLSMMGKSLVFGILGRLKNDVLRFLVLVPVRVRHGSDLGQALVCLRASPACPVSKFRTWVTPSALVG